MKVSSPSLLELVRVISRQLEIPLRDLEIRPGRLGSIVRQVHISARALECATPMIEPTSLVELHLLHSLVQIWSTDPVWPHIRDCLLRPQGYGHALLTMALAQHLRGAGNHVNLVGVGAGTGRLPDIRLVTRQEALQIEVKAPRRLQWLNGRLKKVEADGILANAVRKASPGHGGQLSDQHSGILVVGGLQILQQSIEELERAATAFLARDHQRMRHVVGISVVSIDVMTGDLEVANDAVFLPEGARLASTARVGFVRNVKFVGELQVDTERHEWMQDLVGQVVEIPLPPGSDS
jgi:hypothetical protein